MSAKHNQHDKQPTHHQQAGEWPVSLKCLEALRERNWSHYTWRKREEKIWPAQNMMMVKCQSQQENQSEQQVDK
jgi:hypothetical protein